MAKRVKSDKQIKQITDWQQADEFIKRIGELQIKINAANYQQAAMINQIKETTAEAVKPMQDDITQLVESLEVFSAAHKADFGSDRSRKLNFGALGWRKSHSIIIKKVAETLEKIKSSTTRQLSISA